MAFNLSPGVTVVEKDFTSIVPAVSTSTGAFCGSFGWGPMEYPVKVTTENDLVSKFGVPTDSNFQSFFTAANFLSYSADMYVVRINSAANNATEIDSGNITIKNEDHYNMNFADGQQDDFGMFAARYPGTKGNGLKVVVFDKGSYDDLAAEILASPSNSDKANELAFLVNLFGLGGVNLNSDTAWTTDFAERKGILHDVVHIAVFDSTNGTFSGVADTDQRSVLERFNFLSKLRDARRFDGTNNYYKGAINNQSKYLWWLGHPQANDTITEVDLDWGASSESATVGDKFDLLKEVKNIILSGGTDDYSSSEENDIINAYMLFQNSENYDVSLIMTGNILPEIAKYVIDNVAEYRRDCVVFVSPNDLLEPIIGSGSIYIDKIISFRNGSSFNVNSSFAVMDSGWKYQYDRYNDVYRWVPLNGDIAGLCARTDYTADPWYSPGGFNRGQIKNVVKLGVNPNKAERDTLYAAGVNPVVSFPGQGTILYGDKTLLGKPSAFDRINVRRLFITLEKAIAITARYELFEFNDEFTRAQFKNIVEPYLRDVQGRRGIHDFLVRCDESNNTDEVISRNEFIADVFIKPSYSINFITLNVVATRTSLSFQEVS